jgi:hypothetical protein
LRASFVHPWRRAGWCRGEGVIEIIHPRIQEYWITGVLMPQPHPQPHPFN